MPKEEQRMAGTIQVFVPVGIASTAVPSRAARPSDRPGLIIGLLDNHKHGTTEILDRLQERLTAQLGDVRFVRRKKADAGKSAGAKIIESLAKECSVVLNGIAD
jgi:hypothetical protein